MPKTIANLTLPLVIEEVESALDTYPYHPYQQAFAIPDLRQELFAYILSRTHNFYEAVEEGTELKGEPMFLCGASEHRLHVKALVPKGIQYILQENADWVSHYIPDELDSGTASSHWFG